MSEVQVPNLDSFEDLHPEETYVAERQHDSADTGAENSDNPIPHEVNRNCEHGTEADLSAESQEISSGQSGCHQMQDQMLAMHDVGDMNAYISNLQEENGQLREELQQLKVRELHSKQEHVTAITGKRQELKKQETAHAADMEKLRDAVQDRNMIEDKYTTLSLNYKASIKELTEVKTERDLLTKDRDNHDRFAKSMKTEVLRLEAESQGLRQRNDDLKTSIVLLDETYKSEILKLTKENENLMMQLKSFDKQECGDGTVRMENLTLGLVPGQHHSRESMMSEDQSSGDKPRASRAVGPEFQLGHDPPLHSPSRIKRFKIEPSHVLHCRNCGTVFDSVKSHMGKCRFHAATPQPYQVWVNWLDTTNRRSTGRIHPDDKFWPCCEVVSRHEPKGCKVLRRHDLVDPRESEY